MGFTRPSRKARDWILFERLFDLRGKCRDRNVGVTYRKARFELRGIRRHRNLAGGEAVDRNRDSAYPNSHLLPSHLRP